MGAPQVFLPTPRQVWGQWRERAGKEVGRCTPGAPRGLQGSWIYSRAACGLSAVRMRGDGAGVQRQDHRPQHSLQRGGLAGRDGARAHSMHGALGVTLPPHPHGRTAPGLAVASGEELFGQPQCRKPTESHGGAEGSHGKMACVPATASSSCAAFWMPSVYLLPLVYAFLS